MLYKSFLLETWIQHEILWVAWSIIALQASYFLCTALSYVVAQCLMTDHTLCKANLQLQVTDTEGSVVHFKHTTAEMLVVVTKVSVDCRLANCYVVEHIAISRHVYRRTVSESYQPWGAHRYICFRHEVH